MFPWHAMKMMYCVVKLFVLNIVYMLVKLMITRMGTVIVGKSKIWSSSRDSVCTVCVVNNFVGLSYVIALLQPCFKETGLDCFRCKRKITNNGKMGD